MSIRVNGSKLVAITRQLSVQWQQTKDYWKDAKSQEFEHKYIEELLAGVDKAVTVIEQLDKLESRIRNECE